ncbi:CDP-glucose 4,6-dehydratase [Deltaproteobacteria bacterium TL4]
MNLFNGIYNNKKVLVTGNTGFKGSWLTVWLLELGAKVYGVSNEVPTIPSHFKTAQLQAMIQYFEVDIRNASEVLRVIQKVRPDFVFHLAAQPLVRRSYKEPLTTFNTNVLGTAHLLEALRVVGSPCTAIMITSDKCYDNVEWLWGYRETDALGGKDPYSASKGAAELVLKSYAHSYFADKGSPVKMAIGRAGNVIGGGDWAVDRIIPDCVRAWSKGGTVEIRNPHSTRPWQHVLEPLSGYLSLGEALRKNPGLNGEPYNFGPPANQNQSVKALIEQMEKHWRNVRWKDVSETGTKVHEAGLLKLCCDKALQQLNWVPVLNFEETVRLTIDWYRKFYKHSGKNMFRTSKKQLGEYLEIAEQKGIAWTQS